MKKKRQKKCLVHNKDDKGLCDVSLANIIMRKYVFKEQIYYKKSQKDRQRRGLNEGLVLGGRFNLKTIYHFNDTKTATLLKHRET